jgi:hypothetical protein
LLPPVTAADAESDSALGDWYVSRLVVARRPLLLLISSRSLLPILTDARNVRMLPDRLASLVGYRLYWLGIATALIDREVAAMERVIVRPTSNRSVVGSLVDFEKAVPFRFDPGNWPATLVAVEAKLAETPCRTSAGTDVIFPMEATVALLQSVWGLQPPSAAEGERIT